jgi:hypothetical protein
MTHHEGPNSHDRPLRRFHVALFIVHPTLEPAAITAALGLKAQHSHRVGDRRKNPKGVLLSAYSDTRWRYTIEHSVNEQWFAKELAALVDRLKPHKAFFRDLRSTGGTATINIQFRDREYFGDEVPLTVLADLVDLELDLGIETF